MLHQARCTACEQVTPWRGDLSVKVPCPTCRNTAAVRPHVVWFGKMPLQMDTIYDALLESDLFVAVGTSGSAVSVAAAVEQQQAATQEIARNVQRAAEGTQQVTHDIVQVQGAVTHSGTATARVLSAAGELAHNASTLNQEVDSFLASVRAA